MLGLDGFPHRAIGPELTPRMWAFAEAGGRASTGGSTDLPSSTDPGFCSLLTGCFPRTHGVRTTAWRFTALPAWAGLEKPRVDSIFDACRGAGIRSVAAMGDDRGLLCTGSAGAVWPPQDGIPDGTPLDAHGYPMNAAVAPHILAAAADPKVGLLFGHLNESDTIGHDHGPESAAARECYAATDRLVGEILDALEASWRETLVVIVSDHDMQARTPTAPIDLGSTDLWDGVIPDGGAALVHLRDGVDRATAGQALIAVEGIESWLAADNAVLIAGARPGFIFAAPVLPAGGFHGAPATARTVALVGGGHPAVRRIAAVMERRRPHLADWAPTIGALLGASVRRTDGASLLG
ncbi:MAG: alkaline phosphatase family protein [Candidatus Dormibacteraeota bacterium]|nr:alkaline phosphatase family protein [Candidatus Dormibacteraeota bacterium]